MKKQLNKPADMQDSIEKQLLRGGQPINSFRNRKTRRQIAKKNGIFKAARPHGWRQMGAGKPAENVQTIIKEKSDGKEA